ncbi:MAG: MBL fold metallo-hydrolase [Bacteroidetes bacterium]|nr:MBL fold metallo-hydrolase [Bacteroidota bacterium]
MENKHPYSITFLGTGTSHGIPVIGCNCAVCTSTNIKDKRFRSSVLIESESTKVVVDTGPDFRQQMLRENINWLDAILLTHEHRDHIAGIDDIRVFNYRRKGALTFHCYPRVEKEIREAFAYIFANKKYPGIPEITFKNFENDNFLVGDLPFKPLTVLHYKLPVAGFRVGNLAYITDVSAIPNSTLALLNNLDVLVLGCLRREPHIAHYHLEAALQIAQQIGAKQTYFIHMSHDMGLHNEVEAELPQNVHLSYDGLKLNFS